MHKFLRLLLIRDRAEETNLIRQALRQAGYEAQMHDVNSEAAYLSSLSGEIDVVLAHDDVPGLPVARAIELLRAQALNIPLIVIAHQLDLPQITEWMRQGAADCLISDDPAGLSESIQRALRDRATRDEASQHEKTLRNVENWFRVLFETLPMPISVSRHGIRLYANRAYARLFGYDEVAEVINLPIMLHVAPEYRQEVLERITTEDLEPHQVVPFEVVALRKDGSSFPVRVQLGRIELPDGTANVSFIRDITEQRKVEAAEREQHELSEALRDTAAALTSTLDPDSVMARILANVGRVVPHDSANIMLIEGKAVRFAYWNNYPPECEALFKSLRLPITALYAGWIYFPELAWVRSHSSAPIRVRGQVIGFLNLDSKTPSFFNSLHAERLQIFADQAAIALENAQLYDQLRRYALTLEQRVAQRTGELNRAKERVEAILNNSSDAIVVTGLDGAINQTNPAFNDMFAFEPGKMAGRSVLWLAARGYVKTLAEALRAAVETSQPQRIEIVARRRDKSSFNADVALSPIINLGSQATDVVTSGIVCSVRDITQRKQIEKELQELNRLKTEFLSTAAHELRTPLTAIRGFSEILLTRSLDIERQQRYLNLIKEQSAQLGQLIDDLLDISRLEARRSMALELSTVRIAELLTQAIVPFRESAPRHQIRIEGLADYPVLTGDTFRLGQVMNNLLSNAVKYSPNGGTITIRCRQAGEAIEISVADEGIGMTPEQQTHLFEQFYRADASNTAITGTGLGLAISKRIIELHGGHIWAESTYGVGSTFYFTLPIHGH